MLYLKCMWTWNIEAKKKKKSWHRLYNKPPRTQQLFSRAAVKSAIDGKRRRNKYNCYRCDKVGYLYFSYSLNYLNSPPFSRSELLLLVDVKGRNDIDHSKSMKTCFTLHCALPVHLEKVCWWFWFLELLRTLKATIIYLKHKPIQSVLTVNVLCCWYSFSIVLKISSWWLVIVGY